jgi:hypothetical protein
MNAFYDINYVKEYAGLQPKISRINIYEGICNPRDKRNLKAACIAPNVKGDFTDQLDHFAKNRFGDFTVEFAPGGVTVPIRNLKVGELPNALNGTDNMSYGIPSEEMIQAQVQKILENERLKMRLAQLEEEAENNDMWGQRFGAAINMIIDRFVPGSTQTMETEPTLNGTDDLTGTEAALVILVEQFGEEWLQKFAAKVKADPSLVKQIKAFFS